VTVDDDLHAEIGEARAVLDWVNEQLVMFAPPRQQLGRYIAPGRVLGIPRRGRMVKIGEVWHLGVFLVGSDRTLFCAGDTVRSEGSVIISHNSAYRAERGEYAYAAFRAGYGPGTVVHFGATPIGLDAESLVTSNGPLFVRGCHTFVRWRRSVGDDQAVLLKDYMVERMGLLMNPPAGSTD
jgi:hypothetical protein